jgi:hypothetical protein
VIRGYFRVVDHPPGTGNRLLSMVHNRAISALFCRLVCSVALVAAILVGLPFQSFAQKPIKTTLCAIIRDPQRFHRTMVEFQARFSPGFEVSLLEDAECEKGIAPRFPRKLDELEKLENACKDSPGTFGTVDTAIWQGVFKYHSNSVPTWTLDVRKIRVLTFSCEAPLWGGAPIAPVHLPEPAIPTWPPSK